MAARAAQNQAEWDALNRKVVACDRCQRLRQYCAEVAADKRAAFRDSEYWGRPVPNFGDPAARLLIVGLAPAAHGANRTGRMFTGDRSGEWLYRALFKAGFANQRNRVRATTACASADCAITAAAHCAPPGNKPLPDELAHCHEWFASSIDLLPVKVLLALGQIAWRAIVVEAQRRAWYAGPMPKFGHSALVRLAGDRWLVGSYHPSQQNTFTGVLTETMFDDVFQTARRLLASSP